MSNESTVVGWVTMSRSAGRQRDQDQAMADFGQTRGALNFEPSFDTCILGKISRMEAFNEQFFFPSSMVRPGLMGRLLAG